LLYIIDVTRIAALPRSLRRQVVVRRLRLVNSHPLTAAVKVSSVLLLSFYVSVVSVISGMIRMLLSVHGKQTAEVFCCHVAKKRKAENPSPLTVSKKSKSESLATSGSSSNLSMLAAAGSSG